MTDHASSGAWTQVCTAEPETGFHRIAASEASCTDTTALCRASSAIINLCPRMATSTRRLAGHRLPKKPRKTARQIKVACCMFAHAPCVLKRLAGFEWDFSIFEAVGGCGRGHVPSKEGREPYCADTLIGKLPGWASGQKVLSHRLSRAYCFLNCRR